MRSRRNIAVLLLLVALTVAGCAGASESPAASAQNDATDEPAQREPQGDDSTDTQEPDEQVDESIERTADDETRNDQFVSPVFEALGFDPNDRQAAQDEFNANVEELVRACMAEAGFDYVPNLPAFAPSFARQLELNATISADQFTSEYGYGIATLLELNFREEGVLIFVDSLLGVAPDEARSQGEQAAYEIALRGTTIQGLSTEDARDQAFDTAFDAEPGSCRAYGFDTADNSVGEKFDGLFAVLGDEFAAINENIENDPRVRDLRSEWQTCMAGHGYSYENPDEVQQELFESSNDLADKFQGSPQALTLFGAAADADLAGMNTDDRFDWLEQNGAFQGFSMVPDLQSELDELIAFELTVAGHDAACSDLGTFLEVRGEYEQAFVEQHAEQLQLIAAGEA